MGSPAQGMRPPIIWLRHIIHKFSYWNDSSGPRDVWSVALILESSHSRVLIATGGWCVSAIIRIRTTIATVSNLVMLTSILTSSWRLTFGHISAAACFTGTALWCTKSCWPQFAQRSQNRSIASIEWWPNIVGRWADDESIVSGRWQRSCGSITWFNWRANSWCAWEQTSS